MTSENGEWRPETDFPRAGILFLEPFDSTRTHLHYPLDQIFSIGWSILFTLNGSRKSSTEARTKCTFLLTSF